MAYQIHVHYACGRWPKVKGPTDAARALLHLSEFLTKRNENPASTKRVPLRDRSTPCWRIAQSLAFGFELAFQAPDQPSSIPRPAGNRFMQPSNFHRGDPAPWFVARSTADPRYRIDTAAGRYVVLCFLGSAGDAAAAAALQISHWRSIAACSTTPTHAWSVSAPTPRMSVWGG
jgi:hypothetical protein